MRELGDEQGYKQRCSWAGPITDTHGLGGMTLHAAADYVRTFAELFSTESIPTYGHLVVGRSALESSVVSWWLSEPGIARGERVKRGLTEFLYSATEVFRLKLPGATPQEVKDWTARARELGWASTDYDGKPWKPAVGGRRVLMESKDRRYRPGSPAARERRGRQDRQVLWSRLSPYRT